MKLIRERAGDTLTGVIDGVNQRFVTSFDWVPEEAALYLNGVRTQALADNGWLAQPPRDFVMKQPPEVGDTLTFEYQADIATGGGHLGGCPSAPTVAILEPKLEVQGENIPQIETGELNPDLDVVDLRPGVTSDELRPQLIIIKEPTGC